MDETTLGCVLRRIAGGDPAPMHQLATWLAAPDPRTFPYDAVLAELHRDGKHFAPRDLLAQLDGVRGSLPDTSDESTRVLAGFLDTALDKWDGRFDNPSYLAVDQLPLPGTGERGHDPRHAAWQRDRLFALLVADTLRFELAAAAGSTSLLPQMRPDARTAAKRCRLGVRAIRPALARLGLHVDITTTDALVEARRVCRAVAGAMTAAERRMLQMTVLPVYVAHDEYMFIRMLQSYETTFALVGVQLEAAVAAITDGRARIAAQAILGAERAMREASTLFSFVATMQPQAFLTFREYTEGASAIQSRSYKTVESLCRTPDRARLDSPAYHSVPDVRERVIAGQPTLEQALLTARASGRLTSDMHDRVGSAMQRFEAALLKWRQTHYRLAVRMLGQRRGTGYTEGVPYLDKVRAIPVFAGGLAPAGATA
jgi:tryptophan 2,3-dioxygenase